MLLKRLFTKTEDMFITMKKDDEVVHIPRSFTLKNLMFTWTGIPFLYHKIYGWFAFCGSFMVVMSFIMGYFQKQMVSGANAITNSRVQYDTAVQSAFNINALIMYLGCAAIVILYSIMISLFFNNIRMSHLEKQGFEHE